MEACGLKYLLYSDQVIGSQVTPYGGVWIEIPPQNANKAAKEVTPYGGVWIEICHLFRQALSDPSRLMEACGLKYTVIRISKRGRKCHALWRRVD